jgi:hypothetical protein
MKIWLSSTIYPRHCLAETVPAFANYCSVNIGPQQDNTYSIELLPFSLAANDENLTNEFLNYLLAVSIKDYLPIA